MSHLYPFLLAPQFHERVWGTRDLSPFYDLARDASPIGEAWLTADSCKVVNGCHAGRTVGDLCREFGADFVGEATPQKNRFPLLIKMLFPHDRLSIQVHPDDAAAREIGQPCGKTECWYVAQASPGAKVGLGVTPGTTLEDFRQGIENKTAEHLLNWIDVSAGDMVYVDAGTVHAIGPNMIVLETQQNSDTTYRLYDYGRPRELHVEQGMKAMRTKTHAGKIAPQSIGGGDLLVTCPYFVVERRKTAAPQTILAGSGLSSAQVVVALAGSGSIQCEHSEPIHFKPGNAVVIPACIKEFTIRPHEPLECLCMRTSGNQ